MLIPIRDEPNPPGIPFVNYALIAINVLVYLALTVPLSSAAPDPNDPIFVEYRNMLRAAGISASELSVSAYDLFVYQHGYRPADGSVATIFSSMFLHGGFMHLAGNMLFLWIYGDNVEARLGRVLYPIAYIATGVAATLLHAAFDSGSNIPMVGASGAISGVLGFYFIFFPKNVVHMFLFLGIFMNVIQIPARIVLGIYLVLDNLLPMLMQGGAGGAGVAHGAHIGGFVAGLGAAMLIGTRGAARTSSLGTPEPKVPSGSVFDATRPMNAPPAAAEAQIAALVKRGQFADASQVYFSAPEGEISPAPDDSLEIGRWLAENDHPTAALGVFQRVLKRFPMGETAAWAHLGAGYVQAQFLERPTAAYQHFLDVIDVDPNGDAAERARTALSQLDRGA